MENTFFDTISYKMNGIGNGMYDLFLNLRDSFNDSINNIAEKLSNFWQNLKVWSSNGFEHFISGMKNLGEVLSEFGKKVYTFSSKFFGKVKDAAEFIFEKIGTFANFMKEKIGQGIEYFREHLPIFTSKVKESVLKVVENTKSFLNIVGTKIKEFTTILSAKCSEMKDHFVEGLRKFKENVKQKWPKVAQKIKEIVSNTKVKVAASLVVLSKGSKIFINKLKDKFSNFKENIKSKFEDRKERKLQKSILKNNIAKESENNSKINLSKQNEIELPKQSKKEQQKELKEINKRDRAEKKQKLFEKRENNYNLDNLFLDQENGNKDEQNEINLSPKELWDVFKFTLNRPKYKNIIDKLFNNEFVPKLEKFIIGNFDLLDKDLSIEELTNVAYAKKPKMATLCGEMAGYFEILQHELSEYGTKLNKEEKETVVDFISQYEGRIGFGIDEIVENFDEIKEKETEVINEVGANTIKPIPKSFSFVNEKSKNDYKWVDNKFYLTNDRKKIDPRFALKLNKPNTLDNEEDIKDSLLNKHNRDWYRKELDKIYLQILQNKEFSYEAN